MNDISDLLPTLFSFRWRRRGRERKRDEGEEKISRGANEAFTSRERGTGRRIIDQGFEWNKFDRGEFNNRVSRSGFKRTLKHTVIIFCVI